jgi:hypothetical protein
VPDSTASLVDSRLRLRCSHGSQEYSVKYVALEEAGPRGELLRAVVLARGTHDEKWEALPIGLTWLSRVWHSMFTTWPPEHIDSIDCEHGRLSLQYRDTWVPYERPVMPFGLDRESVWKAEYCRRRQAWRLHRLQRLDYEGTDRPPVFEKDE